MDGQETNNSEDREMPIAVLQNGEIRPRKSLDESEPAPDQIDRDFALLANLCSDSDPADEDRLHQALHEAHEQAKDQVRRQMGLK
jgi:hypothetical protein